jgi:hypothetical protein
MRKEIGGGEVEVGDGRKGGGGGGVSAVMRSCWLDPPTEEREEHVAFQRARGR